MSARTKGVTTADAPVIKSSAPKSGHKRKVRHIYDRADAFVARELGVQMRMLCGVWGWPRGVDSGEGITLTEASTPGHCKRCQRSLERRVRERGCGR